MGREGRESAAPLSHLDAVLREYAALSAGRAAPPRHRDRLSYGELFVQDVDDRTWPVTVHRTPGAVLMLACVGPKDLAFEVVGPDLFDSERLLVTPVVLVRGRAHCFTGIAGKVVLGTLELGPAGVLLLTAWDGEFHFVLCSAAGQAEVIRSGSVETMRAVYDLAPWLARAAADERSVPAPRGYDEDVQRAHARMVQGAPEPPHPNRPSHTAAVRAGFRYVKELCQIWRPKPGSPRRGAAERKEEDAKNKDAKNKDAKNKDAKDADAKKRRAKERALTRGRQTARLLLEVLLVGGLLGLGDLIGPVSELHATLMTIAPELKLSLRALADALRFLERVAGFLVSRASPRFWWVHLRDLVNPESRVHKVLCKMTTGRFLLFDEPDLEGMLIAAVAAKKAEIKKEKEARTAASPSAPAPSPAPPTAPSPAAPSSDSPTPAAPDLLAAPTAALPVAPVLVTPPVAPLPSPGAPILVVPPPAPSSAPPSPAAPPSDAPTPATPDFVVPFAPPAAVAPPAGHAKTRAALDAEVAGHAKTRTVAEAAAQTRGPVEAELAKTQAALEAAKAELAKTRAALEAEADSAVGVAGPPAPSAPAPSPAPPSPAPPSDAPSSAAPVFVAPIAAPPVAPLPSLGAPVFVVPAAVAPPADSAVVAPTAAPVLATPLVVSAPVFVVPPPVPPAAVATPADPAVGAAAPPAATPAASPSDAPAPAAPAATPVDSAVGAAGRPTATPLSALEGFLQKYERDLKQLPAPDPEAERLAGQMRRMLTEGAPVDELVSLARHMTALHGKVLQAALAKMRAEIDVTRGDIRGLLR